MPEILPEEIVRGWNLINEGERDEALAIVSELEKKKEDTPEERINHQNIIAKLIFYLGEFERALKITEENFKESQKLGYLHLSLDAVILKLTILYNLEHSKEIIEISLNEIKRGESILSSFSHENRVKYGRKEAKFLELMELTYLVQRNYDLAIKYCNKALKLNKQFDQNKFELKRFEKHVLEHLGLIYSNKGEFDDARNYYERSLNIHLEDKRSSILIDGYCLRGLGFMYYNKGDLDSSLNYFQQCITLYENMKLNVGLILHNPKYAAYSGIIRCLTNKGDIVNSQNYLRKFKQVVDRSPTNINNLLYPLARVEILKSSTRVRDLAEAENILKELIEKNKYLPLVLSQICDLYLRELDLTNDFTILDEINCYINRMLEIAKNENNFSLLARTKLYQAKIALIRMNMGDARQFLTQAQKIADDNDYSFLAKDISIEHDKLLEQLEKWEGFKKGNAPASERIKLASVDNVIEYLIESGTIENPEVVSEQPVVLLIIAEGGVLLFSFSFTDKWKFDEELFGGFLTAFNSISDEVFSEGLDRVKFGQHTVLMEPVANFSVCYLFKGGSYIAKQKLSKFANHLQKNASIQQTLEKFFKMSQVLEIKDFPFLESLITEVFLSKSSELKT